MTKSIAEETTTARVATVCPTCSGDIWIGRTIGLVDGQWICDRCFLFDDIPDTTETVRDVIDRILADNAALGEPERTQDELAAILGHYPLAILVGTDHQVQVFARIPPKQVVTVLEELLNTTRARYGKGSDL